MNKLNSEVTALVDTLNHPFRQEIERLRQIILSANVELSENIKWNSPNYSFENDDRITMRIQPPKKQVQLIFHRGSKKTAQPADKLIQDPYGLLTWKENDRAIATFNSSAEIEENKLNLIQIILSWLKAAV